MNGQHLSDERIQEYLDGDDRALSPEARDHLAACPACHKMLEDYRRLFSGLGDLPGWEPAPGFADALIPILPARRRFRFPFILGAGLAIFASIAVLLATMKPGMLAALARGFAPLFRTLSPYITKLIERLDGSISSVVAALLAILTVAFADRLIGRKILHATSPRR